MDQSELSVWFKRVGVSDEARQLIERIRSSPPSRRVRSSARSVSGRFPSRKMAVTIQFESHTVELPGIYEMEYDSDVLEYYDQPEPIKLRYRHRNGKSLGVMHTPDFFVIRRAEAGWEEWKSADELRKLAIVSPNRYQHAPDGQWICPPGIEYATQFGLYYRVRSSEEIDWALYRNLQFLEDFLSAEVRYA